MNANNYTVKLPKIQTSAVVFNSPHSGRDYTTEFLMQSALDRNQIRSSEDAFVDDLFSSAPSYGAPLLAASAPRAFVDLNRNITELDPAVVEGAICHWHNTLIASGLGVIPRVVANGQNIYRHKLTMPQAVERLESFYTPYHNKLYSMIADTLSMFGHVLLLDCHSTPHEAISRINTKSRPAPDIILGDRFGSSCEGRIVDEVESAFMRSGFNVIRNNPFAGAYITQHYGRPDKKRNVIQIELNRSLYMDEKHIRKNTDFKKIQNQISGAVAQICEIHCPGWLQAAE